MVAVVEGWGFSRSIVRSGGWCLKVYFALLGRSLVWVRVMMVQSVGGGEDVLQNCVEGGLVKSSEMKGMVNDDDGVDDGEEQSRARRVK